MIREEAINYLKSSGVRIRMTRTEAINYLKSSGMTEEQIETVINAFTCDDAISREAVIDIIDFEDKWLHDAGGHNANTKIAFSGLKSRVKALPSVQPQRKRGKWKWELASNGWVNHICSECGFTKNTDIHIRINYQYCPKCGAEMRGDSDVD